IARQDLDELLVRSLVRGAEDVLGVTLGRVVLTEGRLDAALGLRGVVRLQRALRGERDACARALRGGGGGEAGRAAPDHEHVERSVRGHAATIPEISDAYALFTDALRKRVA